VRFLAPCQTLDLGFAMHGPCLFITSAAAARPPCLDSSLAKYSVRLSMSCQDRNFQKKFLGRIMASSKCVCGILTAPPPHIETHPCFLRMAVLVLAHRAKHGAMICQKDGRSPQGARGHGPMSPHLRSHLLLLVTFIRRPTLARDGEKEGNAEQE
jgi:hypothetical protein